MYLDDLEFKEPIEAKRTPFQTIVAVLEMVLIVCVLVGCFFKKEAFPYANEVLLVSIFGLALFYFFFPIPLFRSQKLAEHVWVQLFGLGLTVFVLTARFKIVGSEDSSDKIDFYCIKSYSIRAILP
jgi:hypothetical protein